MVAMYRLSQIPTAADYHAWRRYNFAPYLSVAHGNRYLNNYANAIAKDYGQLPQGESMPPGSVVVKDSFTVTEIGDVFTGSLSIMEKMDRGFNEESRDWRYTMIMPDGSLFGMTKGEGAANVGFCVSCHATAGDGQDHLFFVPERYRAPLPSISSGEE
jgi:hypothetical protein